MKRFAAGAALALSLTASVTACATISTQQEVQMGQQYAQQIDSQLPIVQDPEVNRYINVLGDSIAKLSDPRNLDWHFFVVNTNEVNAFAVPGGYIYVNRGLIEQADKMDQLAGVLGHEIGHVIKRHTVQQMQKEQQANIGVALACILTKICESQAGQAAIQVGGTALFAKFSREDEAQADEVAVTYVTRAGIDPHGLPEMFQKLLQEEQSSGGSGSGVDAWFATHPTEQSRIADVDSLIAQIDPAIISTLTQDSPNFHAFKQRVAALPAPPPQKQGSP
ncbi:MAG TPA: M48 family metallopeptidase [Gemmatimonadaceae bacterium]|nr:M48 family metallopeptidase [Gemmatimonadaceae bacterium]